MGEGVELLVKLIAMVLIVCDEFGRQGVGEAEGDGVGRAVLFPVGEEGSGGFFDVFPVDAGGFGIFGEGLAARRLKHGLRRDAAATFNFAALVEGRRQRLRDRDFVNRVLGERDADGVADAVRQQRADADGALDPAVLAVAGLGHAEVDWIVPVRALRVEPGDEQAIGLDHHLRVGRLHREDEIVIVIFPRQTGEFQRALAHPERRVAVAVHDAVG